MTFNEQNTIENFILSELTGVSLDQLKGQNYRVDDSVFKHGSGKWFYIPSVQLRRTETDILIKSLLKDALYSFKSRYCL